MAAERPSTIRYLVFTIRNTISGKRSCLFSMSYGKNGIKREVNGIKREVDNFKLALGTVFERYQKGSG